MAHVSRGILLVVAFVASIAVSGSSGAAPPAPRPVATARALAVRIVFPTGRVIGSRAATGAGSAAAPSFSYPSDGSVIETGATRASASAASALTGRAGAASEAVNLSIFDGEITADSAAESASAATGAGSAGGTFQGSGATGLQAFGRPHAFGRAGLQNWGYLTIAQHSVDRDAPLGLKGFAEQVIGLDIHLTSAHGGLPAGTQIEVGYVEVHVQTAPRPVPITDAGPLPGDRPQLLPPTTEPLIGVPQVIQPPLGTVPYVFPVFGRSHWSDSYGSTEPDVAWQHGVDILGSLGQPVLAVAAGTLFTVGWNQAGGNRLWLRDSQGNTFYYAHLSAFSTLTRKGAHVKAGEVIGFMGDTGNVGGLPTHLHFEIHPVSMLFLGYDGAVDPGAYLTSWRRLTSLAFPVSTGWAPTVPGTIKAPEPGAVLIGSSDISSADGLDPASLRRLATPPHA
jgi:murein DD-endopeptidase MepM/ murein hydrolase activator NlpD